MLFRMLQSEQDNNVVDGVIKVLGCIARTLPWGEYSGLLNKALRRLSTHPTIQKSLLKTLCAVIDAFHFSEASEASSEGVEGSEPSSSSGVANNKRTKSSLVRAYQLSSFAFELIGFRIFHITTTQMRGMMVERVVPELQKHIINESDEHKNIQPPAVLAIVKVMRLFPDTIHGLFPPLVSSTMITVTYSLILLQTLHTYIRTCQHVNHDTML